MFPFQNGFLFCQRSSMYACTAAASRRKAFPLKPTQCQSTETPLKKLEFQTFNTKDFDLNV